MNTYADILDRITADRELPDGCDRWALKATDFAGRTRGGFQWPTQGWVACDNPDRANTDSCPIREGDGLCVGLTYRGISAGGHRALCLLLVAYSDADVLGADIDKVRLDRVAVVERLDGEKVLRDYGAGAYLVDAYLRGANLVCANLAGADLADAHLRGADLAGAYLTGAHLRGAYLADAHLRGAYLRGADLRGADLTGANLRGANLVGANLVGANLAGANLAGANRDELRARGAIL